MLADPSVRTFGMSWGNTLNIATRFVAALDRPDLEIIIGHGRADARLRPQLLRDHHAAGRPRRARHSYFTAPLYAGSRESRDTIMRLDVFREVLEKLRAVDAMAMAAGDLSTASLLVRDGLPSDVRLEELIEAGGVGDVLGSVIDAEGRPIDHRINERVIGIGLEDLRADPERHPRRRRTAQGQDQPRHPQRGGINTFVTDEKTALALLETPR